MVLPFTNPSDDRRMAEAVLRTEIQNLSSELVAFNKYRDYYAGDQTLVFGTDKFKSTFGDAFTGFRDNWCAPVVHAIENKLRLQGFRFLNDDTEEDPEILTQVWDAFRANDIDEQQLDLHNGALVEGRSYVILWPDPELGVRLDWNPAQMVRVRYSDDDPRKPIWAAKRWRTPEGAVYVTLYFPDRIEKYLQPGLDKDTSADVSGVRATVPSLGPTSSLQPRRVPGEPWPLPNPFGEVPVVEFWNPNGSEIKDVIPQQDALNKVLLDQLITSEFQAFRQLLIHTANDAPEGGWVSGPGEVWHFKPQLGPDDKAYPFQVEQTATADPGLYVAVVEMYLQHIALTSGTPVRYFFQSSRGGRGDAPSGESLRVEDQPLIDKVLARQARFGNSWYRVARLAAKAVSGNYNLVLPYGEPIWRDPMSDYRSSLLMEAQSMLAIGLPFDFIITKIGLTPEEIKAVTDLKVEEEQAQMAKMEEELRIQSSFAAPTPNEPSSPKN